MASLQFLNPPPWLSLNCTSFLPVPVSFGPLWPAEALWINFFSKIYEITSEIFREREAGFPLLWVGFDSCSRGHTWSEFGDVSHPCSKSFSQAGSLDFLPCDPYSWSLFWFPWHKVTRTFTFPPFNIFPLSISRLSPSISPGFPYNLLIPIYIPGRRDVPRPLALESRWLTITPARSPHAKYLLILIWVV